MKRSRKMAPTISKRNKPDEVIETSNPYDVFEVEEITIDDPSNDITSASSMQNSVNTNGISSGMNSMHIDALEEFNSKNKPGYVPLIFVDRIDNCKQLLNYLQKAYQ
ncbi:hypothetical protein CEXT_201011 [Caerostris extrusa]|uniref:Uncharacterized protein n=1 Tax=Caerostris extrusa TaxID=172846 RepID=A0AAV4WKK4_CAEEX|nr:hypothetical protein CEXT_201011 [Caerostris extrusa]